MNLCDINVVKRVLSDHYAQPKKKFGQNFLINREVPQRIADDSFLFHREKNKEKTSCVLEIGPGIGSLTYELSEKFDKVVAVEIDKTMIPVLQETLSEKSNIEVINEDFLKLSLKDFCQEQFGNLPISVCANLPYYITTPIIMKLLEEGEGLFTSITIMVQKEVADRLCSDEKSGDYGAITASLNYYGKVEKLFDVTPDNFFPSPNVVSSVIRIAPFAQSPYNILDKDMLFKTIKGAFSMRRKTLLNSLSSYLGWISKEELSEILTESGFDINIRGEKLSIDDFCTLSNKLYILKKTK